MKFSAKISVLLLVSFSLFVFGCEEIPPNIDLTSEGGESDEVVDPGVQERQVLMEEFTGVRCVNCPAGADLIKSLEETYGEQLIPVSIHTGFYAVPYSDDPNSDLGIPEGDALEEFLGAPLGYPSAVINRKQFAGENNLQLSPSKWAGFMADEVNQDPVLRIGVRSERDPDTQVLKVFTSVHIDTDLLDDLRLTVVLVEDGIIAKQATTSGEKDDYEHKHVLRKVLTPVNGYSLGNAHLAGDILNNSFTLSWDAKWNYDNCHLVAFVSKAGENKEVLQAAEGILLP